MNNKIKWNDFVARRRLNPKEWVKSKGIKNYSQLVTYCQLKNIDAPTEKESKNYFLQELKISKAKKEVNSSVAAKESLKSVAETVPTKVKELKEQQEEESVVSVNKAPQKKRGRRKKYKPNSSKS